MALTTRPQSSIEEREPSIEERERPGKELSSAWFEVFFDGDCPLCSREIRFLTQRDREQRIRFTDLADPGFDAVEVTGRVREVLDARIHGRFLPGCPESERAKAGAVGADGVIEGVEVFRQLYTAIGWRLRVAVTRWPGVRLFLALGYRLFARFRTRLTGRCRKGSCTFDSPRDS